MNFETTRLTGRQRNGWEDEVRRGWKNSGWKNYMTGMEEAPENGKQLFHSTKLMGFINPYDYLQHNICLTHITILHAHCSFPILNHCLPSCSLTPAALHSLHLNITPFHVIPFFLTYTDIIPFHHIHFLIHFL